VPARSRAARRLLVGAVAVVATGAAVAAGVVLREPDQRPAPPADPLATRLAAIDTGTAVVRRAPFCGAVPPAATVAATAGRSPELTSWSNGDRLRVGSGTEVAHEYGCSWRSPSGTVAAAWVFAPPVTPQRGRELATAAAGAGCRQLTGAAAYGDPSAALTCTSGTRTTVSYRGLFGDAWLVCELTATDPSAVTGLPDLADRWCAQVLLAAGAEGTTTG
jgi:hypothetical protein